MYVCMYGCIYVCMQCCMVVIKILHMCIHVSMYVCMCISQIIRQTWKYVLIVLTYAISTQRSSSSIFISSVSVASAHLRLRPAISAPPSAPAPKLAILTAK